jgi:nicotinamide-nucleotide amidase
LRNKSEVEVILVGNELLKGERRDAHLESIGRALARVGVELGGAHAIGDERGRIAGIVRDRLDDARVIIVSGGLGPTHDDVTREGVADALGKPLEFRVDQWREIEKIFQRFGREPEESNRRQAYFPEGAEPMANPNGTAPGFIVESGDCLIAVLPGPPRELNPMLEEAVLPRIADLFKRDALFTETFRTTGIAESTMISVIQPVFESYGEFTISSLPHIGGVDIGITQKPGVSDRKQLRKKARAFEKELRDRFGTRVYGKGEILLESVIGEALVAGGATLALAESLTGGLIGKRLTDVAGSSRYVLADIVAYSNEAKMHFLGVKKETLTKYGAVSEEVCREMAEGIRERTGATFGLATTGIAGPGGGSKQKPVGLTFYGLSWQGGRAIRNRVFPGHRDEVRNRVTYATLYLLHDKLQGG